MKELIRADLRRILRKPSFTILLIFLLFFQLVDVIRTMEDPDQYITLSHSSFGGIYLMIVTIFAFLSVFADDQKSNAYASIIGTGMERHTLLLAKIIDCTILIGLYYSIMLIVRDYLCRELEMPVSVRQRCFVALFVFFCALRGTSCLILSMLVLYAFDSTSIAILTDVTLTLIAGTLCKYLQTISKVELYDFLIDGLFDNAYANLSVGRLPWQLVPAFVVYFGGAFAAAAAIFQKKELSL
ncbi:MAG: hypothetical protein IJ679_10955 [Lachnospiraceae bacterium]|nr:hypothetical protein [Lachnospiraceae bacterium]